LLFLVDNKELKAQLKAGIVGRGHNRRTGRSKMRQERRDGQRWRQGSGSGNQRLDSW